MRPHILVVEDEQHLAVGIKYNLEAEGYRVTVVDDGPTALRIAGRSGETVDLVVLDLMLPGMSGYTVCQTLREWGLTVPVLMLTARTLAEDRTRGFDCGANQYMAKPFDLAELLSRVKNLLQLGRVQQDAPRKRAVARICETRFGGVHANFDTHEVTVDGQPTRMTLKELRLLRYFVENAERVISRQELLSNVWEMSGKLQTRAVDQFIVRLRKLIEHDPGQPRHLLTIRDAGYRFVPEPDPDTETVNQNADG